MSDFNPDEYLAKKEAFDPDAYLSSKELPKEHDIKQDAPRKDIPLGQRIYESEIYPIARAAENIVPGGATIHHAVIDPAIGYFTGESADERQANRENYDSYIRSQYPGKLEGAQFGTDLVSMPYKGNFGIVEPFLNQTGTHPESVGANLDTAASLAPMAIHGALNAPRTGARAISVIKMKPEERASFKTYEKNPARYDDYDLETGGQGRRAMVDEMRGNVGAAESERQSGIDSIKGALSDARSSRSEAQLGERLSKNAISSQQRNAIEDVRSQTKLGTLDGDKIKEAVEGLKEQYKNTAEVRNKILEESKGQFNIDGLKPKFNASIRAVTRPEDKAAIKGAWDTLVETAADSGDGKTVSARALNEYRKTIQDNITNWGHMSPWERQYNSIANHVNSVLDDAIPVNNPIRAKLKEETLRHQNAVDLMGGDYPLGKIESSLKDPMKRRDLENMDIPAINDIIKTIEYRAGFEDSLKRGYKPAVPAEGDLKAYSQQRSDSIQNYLMQKKALEEAKKQRLPLTQQSVEPTVNTSMVSNAMHPRVGQQEALVKYANEIHEGGPDAFNSLYEKNKVLRDLSTADAANGSRMTMLGRSLGAPIGAVIGSMLDNPTLGASLGGAAGGAAGAYLDYNASKVMRGLTQAHQGDGYSTFRKTVDMTAAPIMKRVQEKIQGTPYQQQFTGDPQKDAITHYVLSQKDPEYQSIIMKDYNK